MNPRQLAPALGDAHNFGRRVSRLGERIVKPRTVVWEQMLLDAQSPLRRLLDEAAEREGLASDAFGFLPDLKFSASDSGPGGEVDAIRLEPLGTLSDTETDALARIAGRSLALWSWLGVSDLHWENLALGTSSRGRVIFSPLDIESLFDDLSLPTETKLLPDADPEYADICQHACGVRRLLPFLGKPIKVSSLLAMAASYSATLAFLDRNAGNIAKVFLRLRNLRETPIRVCLRGTGTYFQAQTEPVWPPLLAAEQEQLDRGDVPYFFRLYNRPGIHYYGDESLETRKRLPLEGDVPQLDPLLSLSKALASANRRSLREEGLFTLLAAFGDPSFSGKHQDGELVVQFGKRVVTVDLPSGEQLQCKRDLSAFVSSVYLPCRCGEVRSVLVPAVTRCDSAGSYEV